MTVHSRLSRNGPVSLGWCRRSTIGQAATQYNRCVREEVVRGGGLAVSIACAAFIVWTYVQQPRTVSQVAGGLTSSIGAYQVDDQAFADGLAFFRKQQFTEARAAFARADPAERDARTQFYIAYSFYREGWGRLYSDDAQFAEGLKRVDLAIALTPRGRLVVVDPELKMHTADELRAELQAGLRRDASDFNPAKLFRERK
jgi:hypothetical protein